MSELSDAAGLFPADNRDKQSAASRSAAGAFPAEVPVADTRRLIAWTIREARRRTRWDIFRHDLPQAREHKRIIGELVAIGKLCRPKPRQQAPAGNDEAHRPDSASPVVNEGAE